MLGDIEDVTITKASPNLHKTFIRCLVSTEGTVSANIYEGKLKGFLPFSGIRGEKVLDFETEFSNGHFLVTSNAEAAKQISQPPEIQFQYFPRETTALELLKTHQKRIAEYLEQSQVQPVVIHSLEELIEGYQRFNALTSAHRKSLGGRITKEEVLEIAKDMGGQYPETAEALIHQTEKIQKMARFSQFSKTYPTPPQDWDDHEAWEKYYVSLLKSQWFDEDEEELEIFFDIDDLYKQMQELQERHCQTIWFPGCGFSRLPKIFAECAFSVHATDISKTAIAFQNSVDVKPLKKQIKQLARRDKSNQALSLSKGTYECVVHDFRTPYLDDYFDVIFNIHALQGFPLGSMEKIANVHYASLKQGCVAHFFTMNVFGQHRNEIETGLMQSGFFVPRYGIEKWYFEALDDTGLSNILLIGGQPCLKETGEYLRNKQKWREDSAQLDRIFQEYVAKLQAAYDNIPSDKKVAMISYSTG